MLAALLAVAWPTPAHACNPPSKVWADVLLPAAELAPDGAVVLMGEGVPVVVDEFGDLVDGSWSTEGDLMTFAPEEPWSSGALVDVYMLDHEAPVPWDAAVLAELFPAASLVAGADASTAADPVPELRTAVLDPEVHEYDKDCGPQPDTMAGTALVDLGAIEPEREGLFELVRVADGGVVRRRVVAGGGEVEIPFAADANDAASTCVQARRVDANGQASPWSGPVCYTIAGSSPDAAAGDGSGPEEDDEGKACSSTGRGHHAAWAAIIALAGALRRRRPALHPRPA